MQHISLALSACSIVCLVETIIERHHRSGNRHDCSRRYDRNLTPLDIWIVSAHWGTWQKPAEGSTIVTEAADTRWAMLWTDKRHAGVCATRLSASWRWPACSQKVPNCVRFACLGPFVDRLYVVELKRVVS